MHRTCADYMNENQTRNARCGAVFDVSPNQLASAAESRMFHIPPQKNHRAMLFEFLKLFMALKFIYANFQDNCFLNELAQALFSL